MIALWCVAVLLLTVVWFWRTGWNPELDQLAARVAGHVQGRSERWGGGRRLHFSLSGRDAQVVLRSDDGLQIRVMVDVRGISPGSLSIHPVGAPLFGAFGDVWIDDPDFRRRFRVQSEDAVIARRLLDADRVAALGRLERFGFSKVLLTRDQLVIEARSEAVKAGPALEAVLAAHVFLKAFDHGTGVLSVEVGAAVGICQVCGTEMRSEVMHCGRCRTPHHEECWVYAGGCSTYGCAAKSNGRREPGRQTPDEWLAAELERDRRERHQRSAG